MADGECYSDGSYDAGEEEDQETAIQSNIFSQYLDVCDEAEIDEETDAIFARGLVRVREYLSAVKDNTMCLICLGTIKPTEATWHCSGSCFALFHLPCIQEWARNQLATAAYKASRAADAAAPQGLNDGGCMAAEWGCPKCRFSYSAKQLPSSYTCFCGKQEDPEWDPWLAAHTCGELCGKHLPGNCQHSCMLLCHPGPCPPCPLLVDASCYCGKAVMKQRCGNNEFSCRSICGRRLPCGHSCPEVCHKGDCPPCQQVGVHSCACGAESVQLPCWRSDWHCSKPCSKLLSCGRHRCEQVCHSGPCGGCPEEGERHCACGKTLYPDLKCDEKAPLCGGTCGKLLDCGVHTCQERCHYGPCSKNCRELVVKSCHCGRSQKQVLCHTDVRCESKCNNIRACGRHPCRRRCCDGLSCPPCEEVCNRKLRCGNHRCPAPCHSGPCRPCPLAQSISCACGKTKYTLPCGAEAAAAPPRCMQRCLVPATCRHAAQLKPHRCHFGPCPPCRTPCGSSLPCGHTCSSLSCHDKAPPAVADWQQPKPPKSQVAAASSASAPPPAAAATAATGKRAQGGAGGQQSAAAEAAAAAAQEMLSMQQVQQPCPACEVLVQLQCLGGHSEQAFPCHVAQPYSCSRSCGRPLACGNHSCSKPCHAVAAAGAGGGSSSSSEPCEVCCRPCTRPRSCSHPCADSCHPGPCAPCQVQCSLGCHCGKTSLHFPCHQHQQITAAAAAGGGVDGGGPGLSDREQETAAVDSLCCGKLCHKELPHCPHPCRSKCHAGCCPDGETCGEEVAVRCSCRRLKQKWPCSRVQAALAALHGGRRSYDGATPLKLLPCDADCAAVQQVKGERTEQQQQRTANGTGAAHVGHAAETTVQPVAAAAAAGATAVAGGKGAKKLSRAEREALAQQREAERLRLERQQKLRRIAVLAVLAAVLLALGVGLALLLQHLLQQVDDVLRDKYDIHNADQPSEL